MFKGQELPLHKDQLGRGAHCTVGKLKWDMTKPAKSAAAQKCSLMATAPRCDITLWLTLLFISSGLCLISANKEFGIFDTFLDSFMEFTVTSRVTKCWNTYINARVGVGSQNCTLTALHQRGVALMPGTWWPLTGQNTELHCKKQSPEGLNFPHGEWWNILPGWIPFWPKTPFPRWSGNDSWCQVH